MKINTTFSAIMSLAFILSSCAKEENTPKSSSVNEIGNEDAMMVLGNDYKSKVKIPLEKPADYEHYTKGVIEYSKDGDVIASIDFGDGTRDTWANKTENGQTVKVNLTNSSSKGSKYTKVITKPLIKTVGCDYIVEGTIKYFKGKKWIATVDYGNGSCDEWATKTWDKGNKTFSLSK